MQRDIIHTSIYLPFLHVTPVIIFTIVHVVKNNTVETPVGKFNVDHSLESKNVNVYIRPEAVKLNQEQTPVNGIKGTVMASKLMGGYSFVHLSVLNNNNVIFKPD